MARDLGIQSSRRLGLLKFCLFHTTKTSIQFLNLEDDFTQ